MWTSDRYKVLLKENNLPQVEGEIIDCRYITRHDDWWVRTIKGWFWLDRLTGQWKHAPRGPPY
jgi:hypothetical protein